MTIVEQPSNKRNWKANLFSYDHYIPDESRECSYCLTDKQAEIIMGMLEPLGWKTRWIAEDSSDIDQDKIEQFRDDLLRRMMMSCCGDESPIRYRYSDSGILQKSTDDGVTWTDSPNNDPRNYSPVFPPIPSWEVDPKCSAANGAIILMKEQIRAQLTDDMTRYTLGQLITDWVKTYIETSNPFQALLTVVANQLFALVIAVVRPALTDGVFETLKCIIYCAMLDDESFNNEKWETVRTQILSQITGVAGLFLEHLVFLLGAVGLTNLVRANPTAGDCSACGDCNCTGALGFVPGNCTVVSVDNDTCTVTIRSIEDIYNPGKQVCGFDFGAGCAHVQIISSDNPSIRQRGWYPCGGGSEHTGIFPEGSSIVYFYEQSNMNVPFTMVVQLTA